MLVNVAKLWTFGEWNEMNVIWFKLKWFCVNMRESYCCMNTIQMYERAARTSCKKTISEKVHWLNVNHDDLDVDDNTDENGKQPKQWQPATIGSKNALKANQLCVKAAREEWKWRISLNMSMGIIKNTIFQPVNTTFFNLTNALPSLSLFFYRSSFFFLTHPFRFVSFCVQFHGKFEWCEQ